MARKLRTTTEADLHNIKSALVNLRAARDQLKIAGAKTAAKYVAAALKSAEGAERHALRAMGDQARIELCTGTAADERRRLRGLLGG